MSKNLNPDGNTLAHDVLGTNYPYLQARKTSLNNILSSFKRNIADYNPFAYPQVASQKRMAFEIRSGNAFYVGEPYPNPVHWDVFFPTHFDPISSAHIKQMPFQTMKHGPMRATIGIKSDRTPRGCVRQLQQFYRCQMINGTEKCDVEKNNILSICPNWTLEGFKEKHRQLQKIEAIQTHQYRKVLEISDYNKGKSPKTVSDKNWIHGTREHLRPDTMWADERYVNINQQDVNEAKKRLQKNEEKSKAHAHHHGKADHDHSHGHGDHHYDFKGSQFVTEKPIYP